MSVHDKRKRTIYSIYKGDDFVDVGTKEELMQKYNLKSETFNFYTTKTYHKRVEARADSKSAFVIYKVGVLKRK